MPSSWAAASTCPGSRYEWAYCRAHFFEAFLQKEPPRWLDRLMEEVHASLHSRARFLAHREFNVLENLMVQQDRLVMIDFQDARCGAATYDLPRSCSTATGTGPRRLATCWSNGSAGSWAGLKRISGEELSLSALQRNLRALGHFGCQLTQRRSGQAAAPAILRTLRHLRGHFQRLRHGEGVLAAEHWLRLAEKRLWRHGGADEAEALG